MAITFKTNYPTGQYRSFDHIYIVIKLNKQEVGTIGWQRSMTADKEGMRVSLRVAEPTSACGWKTITLKKTFEGFGDKQQGKAAKEWVKTNWDAIAKLYQIHPLTEQPSML